MIRFEQRGLPFDELDLDGIRNLRVVGGMEHLTLPKKRETAGGAATDAGGA